MYDYKNLNDWEFESLCKDMMQKLYKISLRCFKPGKDGGVDVADIKSLNSYISQAKNYKDSNFSTLFSSLKKEIPKVVKADPKQYYICTSLPLSRAEQIKILTLFDKYMPSAENILDGTRIDDFLREESNKDILYKYYKLWMQSTNVMSLLQNQDIMIDAEVLEDQIVGKHNLYVPTHFYKLASQKLRESKALLVLGSPGVGKTTICNMLVLQYLSEGFSVRYSSSKNIEKLKQSITRNSNTKELLYIDDFLGQSYLELKSDRINEIQSLIAFIKKCENKYILLNSRITVHIDASNKYGSYSETLKKLQIEFLDINKMSLLDKAKILYNHLYFNGIDDERLDQIKQDKNYLKIIKHKNYNPRLIEQLTNISLYDRHSSKSYFSFIMNYLDAPTKLWSDEFTHNISIADRILLTTLFSLTRTSITIENLKLAYNVRIKNEQSIDTTINNFEDSITRLNGGFVKIIEADKTRYIAVINPSVNDFLHTIIDEPEKERIIKSAYFIEQIENLTDDFLNSDLLYSLCIDGSLFKLHSYSSSLAFYYLICLNNRNDRAIKFPIDFIKAFDSPQGFSHQGEFAKSLINISDYDFWAQNKSFRESLVDESNVENILNLFFEDESAVDFIEKALASLLKLDATLANVFWHNSKETLIWKIEISCIEEVENNIDSLIDNAYGEINRESFLVQTEDDYYLDEERMRRELEWLIDSSLDDKISAIIDRKFPIFFANKTYVIEDCDVDKYNITSNIDISEAVAKRIKYYEDSLEPNILYDGPEPDDGSDNVFDIIDDMFDR